MVVDCNESEIVILDNGGSDLKLGKSSEEPRIIPNSIVKAKHEKKRVFIAQEQEECLDKFSLFYVRPLERGYISQWDVQQRIWDTALKTINNDCSGMDIVLTDNNYLVPTLPDLSSEIFFEYFNFNRVLKGSASYFTALNYSHIKNCKCILVVDCGFSFTHISPYVDGLLIQNAVIRIDIGGKALTNKLKDWISYRQLNVMEETHIINQCKEDLCYVSQDFDDDIKLLKKGADKQNILKRYIMPDFHKSFKGVVQEINDEYDSHIPSIVLGVERFAIPEILFNPSDIDLNQVGVAEGIVKCLERCPKQLRPALSENIVVIGGSTKFPGFRDRLLKELRSLITIDYNVSIINNEYDPQIDGWMSAKGYVKEGSNIPWMDRNEWNEIGEKIEFEKFLHTFPDCIMEEE